MQGKKELPPFLQNDKPAEVRRQISIPKELRCPVCGDIVKEAVLIPCCGMSYCDDCKFHSHAKYSDILVLALHILVLNRFIYNQIKCIYMVTPLDKSDQFKITFSYFSAKTYIL